MTASELNALGAEAAKDAAHYRGLTEQVRFVGLTARQETYGLPDCDTHLIQKLRNMDPDLRATITGKDGAE